MPSQVISTNKHTFIEMTNLYLSAWPTDPLIRGAVMQSSDSKSHQYMYRYYQYIRINSHSIATAMAIKQSTRPDRKKLLLSHWEGRIGLLEKDRRHQTARSFTSYREPIPTCNRQHYDIRRLCEADESRSDSESPVAYRDESRRWSSWL